MDDPLIAIEALSKNYPHASGSIIALDNITLSIERKDIFGIIGMSGAGKSTLMRCLAQLIEPTAGRILFQGRHLATMSCEERRQYHKNIGMIFQQFNLLSSRTASGNIAYPLEISGAPHGQIKARVDLLLELVSLTSKRDCYPLQLSGGEKQRVGVARALANRPEVLFCDEATSALDPKTTKEILSLLKEINNSLGITIILITHDMEVVKQICNKVAVIEGGRIVEVGNVVDLFAAPRHPTTQHLVQNIVHELPNDIIAAVRNKSPRSTLLRLRFRGDVSSQPLISQMIKKYNVDANILLGWVDRLKALALGTLIIEISGDTHAITQSLQFLQSHDVHCEELTL